MKCTLPRIILSALLMVCCCFSLVHAGLRLDAALEYRHQRDFFLSGSLHGQTKIDNTIVSVFGTFGGRLGARDVVVDRHAYFIQQKEKRTFLIFGLDGTLMVSPVAGLYGTAGFGHTWGWFKTQYYKVEAANGWFPTAGCGIHFTSPKDGHKMALRLGYQFKNIQTETSHGITLSLLVTE